MHAVTSVHITIIEIRGKHKCNQGEHSMSLFSVVVFISDESGFENIHNFSAVPADVFIGNSR